MTSPPTPSIHRRLGTWSAFRGRMLARLHQQTVPSEGTPPLAALTTRDPSDPTIALLDAAAVVFDVLAFYQERYAMESWLHTATERRSLVEIARSLGYEPGSGVAAGGWLSFELAPNHDTVSIPAGTAVMALPTGSTPPPVFETTQEILAYAAFSRLPGARYLPISQWPIRTDIVRVTGTSTRLQAGAAVLMIDADSPGPPATERFEFRRVLDVSPEGDRTALRLERPIGTTSRATLVDGGDLAKPVRVVHAMRATASLFGASAPDWWAQSEEAQRRAWIRANRSPSTFAPPDELYPTSPRTRITEWPDFPMAEDPAVIAGAIDLDREVLNLAPGTWIVLEAPGLVEAFRIARLRPVARSAFGLNARVHRLLLERGGLSTSGISKLLMKFPRRGTTVHLQSEPLTRAADPWTGTLSGRRVPVLGAVADGLLGRTVSVTGTDAGAPVGVVTTVNRITTEPDGASTDVTWLELAADLPPMDRMSVLVCGNVAPATHGATGVLETLGSGAASLPFQRFRIRQAPITQVQDAGAPRGVRTTAVVRVGGRTWTPVVTLADAGPNDRVFQMQRDHDGTTVVTFGDGKHGARLPTGAENVAVTTRVGLGTAGNVATGAASIFTRRPPGLQAVYNATPFAGGTEPDAVANLRVASTREIVAVDRLVSLRDYELFGLGFEGVAKASARAASGGNRRLVHLTVSPSDGTAGAEQSALLTRVRSAVSARRDPEHTVVVDLPRVVEFGLVAGVHLTAGAAWSTVLPALLVALNAAFGFDARGFGDPVASSEVLAAMHNVAGVLAVDLVSLHRADQAEAPRDVLLAQPGYANGVVSSGAELLLLASSRVALTPVSV